MKKGPVYTQRNTWKEADGNTQMVMTRNTRRETGEHKTGQIKRDRQTCKQTAGQTGRQRLTNTEKDSRERERQQRDKQTKRYRWKEV